MSIPCLGLVGNLQDSLIGLYCTTINAEVQKVRGGRHSAVMCVKCVDTGQIEALVGAEDWRGIKARLVEATNSFRREKIGGLVICGSALNAAADDVARAVHRPIVRMARAMAGRLRGFPCQRVCILGIRTKRELEMWRQDLEGYSVLQPEADDRAWLNDRVRDILDGKPISPLWLIEMSRIISVQRRKGAQAIVVAAHPLGRLLATDDFLMPVFDAAETHAWAAGLWSVAGDFRSAPPCCIGRGKSAV